MPPIRFYNTLTHGIDEFQALDPPRVAMYNCGPTVYDFAHIGNFRAFVFADVLRRFLEFVGYKVHQVMNITDVGHMTQDAMADGGGEDKMNVAVERLKAAKHSGQVDARSVDDPSDPYQVAEYFTAAFLEDARSLKIKVASEPGNLPRATQHIDDMLRVISKLVAKDDAYVASDGAVYFDVQKFPQYGRLSGNTLDQIRGGAGGRVQAAHQEMKRHPADFLLWKPDETQLMKWDSPFGSGYPGWHIECTAMAMAVLGREVIDIHTGGEDNIFPHHECEIAQSCSYSGEESFSRFWMHTRFLLVEGEKMSKSRGNFFTVRDLFADGVDPAVLRYELFKAHYRSNMNFTRRGLEDSASAVRKLRTAARWLEEQVGSDGPVDPADSNHPTLQRFVESLGDDLNVSGALAAVFEFIADAHPDPAASLAVLRAVDTVLGVLPASGDAAAGDVEGDAVRLAARIDAARAARDFKEADRIRGELQDAGYDVMTTKEGTKITRRLA